MTDTERYRQVAEILNAKADGQVIEYLSGSSASVCYRFATDELFKHPERYRIKPKPKTRPWQKPEDVPGPVVWLRLPGGDVLALGFTHSGIQYAGIGDAVCTWTWMRMERIQFSTDRVNWKPCTVEDQCNS